MGPICCPETSVHNYKFTLRDISEERISHTIFLSGEEEDIPYAAFCLAVKVKFKHMKDLTYISDVPPVCACVQSRNIE